MRLDAVRRVAQKHPFWRHVDVGKNRHCWDWTGVKDKNGYGRYGSQRAHRVALELTTWPPLGVGEVVRHLCDRPACCNPLHLERGTQQENMADRDQRGNTARGAFNGRAQLSNSTVLEIAAATGHNFEEIGARFGVSRFAVADIKKGKTWGWLTGITYRVRFPRIPAATRGATKTGSDSS